MLIDLDELVAECPDPRSRKYIRESVQCYKAGAYRASVVACWIAVAFDLVDKIRELAASGDAMAAETIAKFDKARQNHDIPAALAFERDLLSIARDKFQFISHIEFVDLERLVEDRNRCAHPSKVSDTEVFEATPELARLHIVNATRYVLSQPAAQGKQALERLVTELDSNFFPSKRDDTLVFLRASALAKPRESLLRSYLSILLKRLMKEVELGWEASARTSNAFFALSEIHPEPWKRMVPELLSALVPNLQQDDQLTRTVKFIGNGEGMKLWPVIGEADRLRLITFVENLPSPSFDAVETLLEDAASPFFESTNARVNRASSEDLFNGFWFDTPEAVIDRMLSFYRHSQSFAQANDLAKKLRYGLHDSKKPYERLARLASIAVQNEQVKHSNQFPTLVKEFVAAKMKDKERAKNILREAKLDDLADEL
ncbi:conserved hypothetical protein [Paraburkholderia piptadeniae]|uniref:Uncharacterized protein n=1 Tax=Paraburkholderia piptadeniae TaxID=1701573 RepID=A0A1N7S2S4_9BURK|nr:hypothetical protein [Paraburkholderia piptadeniae]SIT41694.1 conserved hypothetical protein [Paraburkholderia piptadeniae]